MIKVENMPDGRMHTYSDAGMMIRQIETGAEYEDAVDNVPFRYTYEETDKPIPSGDGKSASEDYRESLEVET